MVIPKVLGEACVKMEHNTQYNRTDEHDPSTYPDQVMPPEETAPLPEPVFTSDRSYESWMLPSGAEVLDSLPPAFLESPSPPNAFYSPDIAQRTTTSDPPVPRPFFADELVNHVSTGDSVYDVSSELGASGRFYHGYKEGRYLFPNDAVSFCNQDSR